MKQYSCVRIPWDELAKTLEKWSRKGWTIHYLTRCRTGSYEVIFEKAAQ